MRERESEMCSGQRASGLQCTTKFEPVTQPVRGKSDQVRAHHAASGRQKRPSPQAVMERVCDEKSGERRGDNLKMTTQAVACFRKIFAAQIPPSPQRDQARTNILESPRRNATKPGQTSWKAQDATRPSQGRHLEKPKTQRDQAWTNILKSPRNNVTQPGQTSSSRAR